MCYMLKFQYIIGIINFFFWEKRFFSILNKNLEIITFLLIIIYLFDVFPLTKL